MHEITLICTVHEEAGACSLGELHRIIERINPEIIFEEIPPSAFDEYYRDRTRSNLETRTIDKYLQNHQVDHIPVDYHNVPAHFFENDRKMHRRVEGISIDYRRLLDTHSAYTRQYGFAYLNSIYCCNLHKELHRAIEAALQRIDDEDLFRTFQLWNAVNEKREHEMISNIYKYSREHRYERGLFFLGAGHRRTIIDKIQAYAVKEQPRLAWNYDQYERIIGNA
jgi:hypothetical protein